MKMSFSILMTAIFCFSVSPVAHSQEIGQEKVTYCGAGFTEFVVPDEFVGCEFTEACRSHDVCYGRCDKSGDLYGSDYCKLSEKSPQRKSSKRQCDDKFRQDIIKINSGEKRCKVLAGVYRLAVKLLGQGPFNGREALDLYEKLLDASESEHDADIRLQAIYKLSKDGAIDIKQTRIDQDQIIIPTSRPVIAETVRDPRTIVIPRNLQTEKVIEIGNAGNR